jgi:predicted nucleic acid-binding protein
MSLVLDASALAAILLPDEDSDAISDRLAEAVSFHAPWLIWADIRNILIVAERRGRIGSEDVIEALAVVSDLRIALDIAPVETEVLRLARTHRLTAYDALYLEAALRLRAPLLTLDGTLLAAARAEGARDDP